MATKIKRVRERIEACARCPAARDESAGPAREARRRSITGGGEGSGAPLARRGGSPRGSAPREPDASATTGRDAIESRAEPSRITHGDHVGCWRVSAPAAGVAPCEGRMCAMASRGQGPATELPTNELVQQRDRTRACGRPRPDHRRDRAPAAARRQHRHSPPGRLPRAPASQGEAPAGRGRSHARARGPPSGAVGAERAAHATRAELRRFVRAEADKAGSGGSLNAKTAGPLPLPSPSPRRQSPAPARRAPSAERGRAP